MDLKLLLSYTFSAKSSQENEPNVSRAKIFLFFVKFMNLGITALLTMRRVK